MFKKSMTSNNKGFSLIELILVMAILGIIVTLAYSMHIFGIKAFAIGGDKTNVQSEARKAADFITKEIRLAAEVELLASTSGIPSSTYSTDDVYIYKTTSGGLEQLVYRDKNGAKTISVFSSLNLAFTSDVGKTLHFSIDAHYKNESFLLDSEVFPLNMQIDTKILNTTGIALHYFRSDTSVNNTLYIHPAPLNIYANTAYTHSFLDPGGTSPYNYTLISGGTYVFPPGLTLSSSGVISGTPTTPGKYVFKVKVTDSANPVQYGARAFAIIVGDPAVTAASEAAALGPIAQPAPGATTLILPSPTHPEYIVVISSTPDAGLVSLNGTITPPGGDTSITLTLKVINLINNTYSTANRTVIIPSATGNHAPMASNVTIAGSPKIGQILTGVYSYSDAENDPQSGSSFQWYRSNTLDGAGKIAIAGATSLNYTCTLQDENKYLIFEVIPRSSVGTLAGVAVQSSAVQVSANTVPRAINLSIKDANGNIITTAVKNDKIYGYYTYIDEEGDAEFGTVYQWKISNSPTSNPANINNANNLNYTVKQGDRGKYLYLQVTPGAANQPSPGVSVLSAYVYIQ